MMEYIVRGSNSPLVLKCGDIKIYELYAQISQYGIQKKTWKLENVSIRDDHLILPLSEKDTFNLTRGRADLSVKVKTPQGAVLFMNVIHYKVLDHI